MPNSLRCKIKSQMHKGLLTEKDGQRLIDALDRAENKWKNCNQYGMLYTWTAVLGIPQSYLTANYTGSLTGIQGACPDGWHVPTKAEMTAIGNSTNTSLRNIINKDVGSYEPTQSPGWQTSVCYWMAEEYANVADVAWEYSVFFNSLNQYKRNGCYLRCVR